MITEEFSANDLGISGVNLKAATTYTGQIIDLSRFRAFIAIADFTLVGTTTAGTAALSIELLGSGGLIVAAQDLMTSLISTASGIAALFADPDLADAIIKTMTGSVAAGANARKVLRHAGRARLKLTTSVAYDSETSAVGSVKLFAKP